MGGHFQGLGHVAIYTRDIGESAAFYEALGGEVTARGSVPTPGGEKELALVSFGGITLELIRSPGPVQMGGPAGPFRGPGELVLHRPLGRADRAAAYAVKQGALPPFGGSAPPFAGGSAEQFPSQPDEQARAGHVDDEAGDPASRRWCPPGRP